MPFGIAYSLPFLECWAPVILYGIWHGLMNKTVHESQETCTCGTSCSVGSFALLTHLGKWSYCIIKFILKLPVRDEFSMKNLSFVSGIHLNVMF